MKNAPAWVPSLAYLVVFAGALPALVGLAAVTLKVGTVQCLVVGGKSPTANHQSTRLEV
jgi:hypothetical protein